MSRQLSPHTAFLVRVLPLLAVLLAIWWYALLPLLLGWERVSTDLLLSAFPKAPLQTGVTILPGDIWVLQAPARVNGVTRNVRLELPQRLPTQLTIAIPLFWAIVLAAARTSRLWRVLAVGTAILLLLPPLGLLAYAAHVVQIYVYPAAPALLARFIAGVDYVASTVLPYVGPVLLAVVLHPELGATVLGRESSGVAALR
jgi:hypothetical protein